MSQVQNTLLHNYVQPITVLAIAYIAGSKRFIHYFPGASREGLFLAGGLGTVATLASPKLFRTKSEEHPFFSFTRVATCLSLGTFITYTATKSLTGRLTLSLPAASHFIGVELVTAGGFATLSFLTLKPPSPAEKNPSPTSPKKDTPQTSPTHNKDGKPLDPKKTPPPTSQHEKDKAEGTGVRPLSALNKEELEKYTQEHPSLYVKEQFALNEARQVKHLEGVWPKGITPEHVQYASDHAQTALLYSFYAKHPLALEVCDTDLRESLTKLFDAESSLPKLPSVHDTLISLSVEQIRQLTKEEAQVAFDHMDSDDTHTHFHKLSPDRQLAYNTTFKEHEITCFWINPITLEHVNALPTIPQGIKWMHEEFSDYPVEFAQIDKETKEPLLKLFAELNPIPSPESLLQDLDIGKLDEDTACEWHAYFTGELDHWRSLTSEIQTAFLACFKSHNMEIDTDLLPKDTANGSSLLNKFFSFLNP